MKHSFLRINTLSAVLLAMTAQVMAQEPTPPYLDDNQPIEVRVEDALSRMTLKEKIAIIHAQSKFSSPGCPRLGIPELWMSDGPHGVRRQLGEGDHLGIGASKPATCFPTAGTVANSWDPALAEEMGEALGSEAHDLDVNVLLGPGLNIKRNPLCGRNFEYYSEDPIVAGRMAAGLIRGIQSNGISACPKHFAVNSQELRRQASN